MRKILVLSVALLIVSSLTSVAFAAGWVPDDLSLWTYWNMALLGLPPAGIAIFRFLTRP